ncbi:MAG: class I SAM-dependent methyltransferase [Bacilli bacterium]|nr:class I SAM-dependent methyltransferase [Bacilli bacterium]
MRQNIYDDETFYTLYDQMREEKKHLSANDLIEIPTIRSMLPDLNGKRILELGCGYGDSCAYFSEKGAKYILGTDISSHMIDIAKIKHKSTNCKFQVLAMEDISTIHDKFDIIVSSLAFHYVEDFEKLLQDIYKLLKDDGLLIFSQEHPIGTGTILNDACHNSDNITLADKRYYLVSDYNINGKRIVDWNNCKVVKYHRNFNYIINTLQGCNFQIEDILEPTPTKEVIEKRPDYKNQLDKPFFLFIKARKIKH